MRRVLEEFPKSFIRKGAGSKRIVKFFNIDSIFEILNGCKNWRDFSQKNVPI
jgi:hypothetical protein